MAWQKVRLTNGKPTRGRAVKKTQLKGALVEVGAFGAGALASTFISDPVTDLVDERIDNEKLAGAIKVAGAAAIIVAGVAASQKRSMKKYPVQSATLGLSSGLLQEGLMDLFGIGGGGVDMLPAEIEEAPGIEADGNAAGLLMHDDYSMAGTMYERRMAGLMYEEPRMAGGFETI